MSSSEICYWVKTYTHTPAPTPNKKLIGFGSFEKVKLEAGWGSGPLDPRPATPLDTAGGKWCKVVYKYKATHPTRE